MFNMENANIFNGTAHDIYIIDRASVTYRPKTRKYVVENGKEAKIVASIPINIPLSVRIEESDKGTINGIPVIGKKVISMDSLPEGYDVCIVSAQYAKIAHECGLDTSSLFTVMNAVYKEDEKTIIGCLGIGPAFEIGLR